MTNNSDRADRLVKKQIFNLNRHLPSKRKNLKELLEEDRPHVIGADGTRHRFKSAALQKISKLIPSKNYHLLKLPLYLEIESQTSGARISGKMELEVVCQILDMECRRNEIYIYRPDLKIVRRELPPTTQYIFLVR